MMRVRVGFALATLLAFAQGCSFEDERPGAEGACGEAPGTLLGCSDGPIETPEQACRKLLECGAIDLEDPNQNDDYPHCVTLIRSLPDYRFDFVLACIQSSTCDDLQQATCIEHGEGG